MSRFHKFLGAAFAVGGLLTGTASMVSAQDSDTGIVRISDCSPGEKIGGSVSAGVAGAAYGSTAAPCGNCNNCRTGYGTCQSGCGHHGGYHCTRCVHGVLSWLNPWGGCALPPDAGWAPPGKIPMHRRPVTYNKFFPDQWTGQPTAGVGGPRLPQVYMPTDTTQLGHYYQVVPQWQPRPGMIPGAPNPNHWHQPLCNNTGVVGASATTVCPAPQVVPSVPEAPPVPAEPQISAGAPNLLPTPR